MTVFGSRKKSTADNLSHGKIETLIGEGTQIKGTFQSSGVVRVDGFLEGSIEHDGDLIVGPKGRIQATIKARSLATAGEIHGDVEVAEKLELLPGAHLKGDVRCGHLVIHEGARFHGRSLMSVTDSAEPPQPDRSPGD
ncbi:conserved hypothetical protein [Symbiobacterium thermophilum IAM 14863]|uniref:Cell shape determination protein CcmA n=1 Tax=Symbiobacterium thermophilum (strain DSM 24528 / JCM 14929 / IAM 14863 / T) TaxID=292459 RepID=Q67J43_SYMTH|nr:conserved hypothetical protein [Symbiobacterium thermophilum IAM 14863]